MNHKFAFVFPGQGSQSIGMLADLSNKFLCVKKTFNQASDVLGYDLWDIVQNGPKERLDETTITQPLMLAADISVYRAWCELTDAKPSVMAGHSLGEYAAMVVADAMAFNDAIALVAKRGEYMQAAVPAGVGSMAAILGLDEEQVREVCLLASESEVLAPANYNSIGQTVIAGHDLAVKRGIELAKVKGAKIAKLIPVSVPSHSPLMQPAAEQFLLALKAVTIKTPTIPILHNVDVMSHQAPEALCEVLVSQLVKPVRWVETIQKMHAEGIRNCVECGPGKVLMGLIKRIDRSMVVWPTEDPQKINAAVEHI